MVGWHETMAKLTGKLVNVGQYPTEKKRRKGQSVSQLVVFKHRINFDKN